MYLAANHTHPARPCVQPSCVWQVVW